MKKKSTFFALLMMCMAILSFSSCSDEANNVVHKPGGAIDQLDGGFMYNKDVMKINSTVYTTQETEGMTTFYLSPSTDIHNIDEMIEASNYIKIVVANPVGAIDLKQEGNQILYKDIDVNASTLEDYSKAKLSIRLTSHKTMALSLDVENKAGVSLKSEYYGLCSLWPKDDSYDADYVCTETYDSSYLGEVSSGATNYYLVFTTGPYDVRTEGPNKYVVLKEEGYLLALDLFVEAGENKLELPTGTFEPSDYKNNFSYDAQYSAAVYHDGEGSGRNNQLDGPITIAKQGDIYTIQAGFIDENGMPMKIVYRGELHIEDNSRPNAGGRLPAIMHDVEFKGVEAQATYLGNLMQGASGMMQISIMDEVYRDDNKNGQGGLAASVVVFNRLFSKPKDIKIIPGVYYPARNFANGSWMLGLEVNAMGFIVPMGTYVQKDDGTNMGQFAFGNQGTVVIEESEKGFKITFDLISHMGYHMKGVYDGPIPVSDESEDDSKDDGTSTLEEDHDMDLSPITTARLFPRGEIEGDKDAKYSHYRIDIGSRGGWDQEQVLQKGDIFSADLVVEQGDQLKIVPGTYKVSPDRFPASIYPGVAVRGHFVTGGEFDGTSWMHFVTGAKDLYLDGHVLGYDGEVKVSKAREGDNIYTFDVDIICVRKMHVRGSWTGPVINGQTGEPILCSTNTIPDREETAIPTFMDAEMLKLAAGSMPEVKKRNNMKL